MNQFTIAILREKDLPTISRVGGASTTQMVTPKCGAKSILNGFTTIPRGPPFRFITTIVKKAL